MKLAVDVLGDEELSDDLDDLGDRAGNMRPAFLAVLRFVMVPRLRSRFTGAGWTPLADATVERKRRAGQDTRILRATGALEDALTGYGRATGRLQTVGKSTVRIGAGKKLFYARFHQFGTKKMPKRELFGWEPADRTKALKLIDRYLFGGGRLT